MVLEKNKIFLDASYAIALASSSDDHHAKAKELAVEHEDSPFVTTQPVLLEIGNALSELRHRETAALYLEAVEEESTTEVVPLSPLLFIEDWIYLKRGRIRRGVWSIVSRLL